MIFLISKGKFISEVYWKEDKISMEKSKKISRQCAGTTFGDF